MKYYLNEEQKYVVNKLSEIFAHTIMEVKMSSNAKMIKGSVSKKMGHVSTVHFRIEASVDGNEKVFSVHTFDGLSYNMDIDDVIDVIFQAYRSGTGE